VSSYFQQTQFISNSELTKFKQELFLMEKDLSRAFREGSLFDATMTEEHKLEEMQPEPSEREMISLMKEAFLADPGLEKILRISQKQHEIYKLKFPVEWNGMQLEIPTKVKFDFLMKAASLGADLKSTACTSEQAFLTGIDFLDYDRQGAWYMDHAKLDKFMFIGVSKKKNSRGIHRVFKHVMCRDDEMYNSGKRKYSFLAFKYYYLIHNFNIS
jgi:hypothetical protein